MTSEEAVKLIELKPCPFCGGEGRTYADSDRHWYVYCDECDAMTSLTNCNGYFAAIEAWNRRHGEGALLAKIDELYSENGELWDSSKEARG